MDHAAILARLLAERCLTPHTRAQFTEAMKLCTRPRGLSVGESVVR